MTDEIIDCHYCDYACTKSPCDTHVDCYVDDGGYFDHHVKDAMAEAAGCEWFRFCDSFLKF